MATDAGLGQDGRTHYRVVLTGGVEANYHTRSSAYRRVDTLKWLAKAYPLEAPHKRPVGVIRVICKHPSIVVCNGFPYCTQCQAEL